MALTPKLQGVMRGIASCPNPPYIRTNMAALYHNAIFKLGYYDTKVSVNVPIIIMKGVRKHPQVYSGQVAAWVMIYELLGGGGGTC